jgi:hypothetical protein
MTDKYGATPTGVGAICTRPLTARMSILWPSLSPLRLQALNLPHHTLDTIHKLVGVWEPPAARRTLIRCICTGLRSESLRCAWPSVWAREILVLFPPVHVATSRSVNLRELIGTCVWCVCMYMPRQDGTQHAALPVRGAKSSLPLCVGTCRRIEFLMYTTTLSDRD